MCVLLELMRGRIDLFSIRGEPVEVHLLRGDFDTAILLTNILELIDRYERLAVEIIKLAEKRHEELVS